MNPGESVASQERGLTRVSYPIAEHSPRDTKPPGLRYRFGAAVELCHAESGEQIVPTLLKLSRAGCHVRTNSPFERGTRVKVRITHLGVIFRSDGEVLYSIAGERMAIRFDNVDADDQLVLSEWLAQINQEALERRICESTELGPSLKQEIIVILSILGLVSIVTVGLLTWLGIML